MFPIQACNTGKLSGTISVERKLNNPVIIDFVFVFDQPTLEELQKVPSLQWFASRSQYKMDLELNDKIEILSYELVPGQNVEFKNFRPRLKKEALIIFVSYLTPGDHRVVIKDYTSVNLTLKRDDFTVKVLN